MRDHCRYYPERSCKMRVKLAQILIRDCQRPVAALRVLEEIPPGSLPADLEAVRQKLAHKAQQMLEEGSELAPVHRAHELYKKTAAEELPEYTESKPAVFKGSQLGEGRISVFTASGGGFFGSKLRGYHVTLLTRDRRLSILCHCPEEEFANLKPTFLAVCRSLSR